MWVNLSGQLLTPFPLEDFNYGFSQTNSLNTPILSSFIVFAAWQETLIFWSTQTHGQNLLKRRDECQVIWTDSAIFKSSKP